MLGFVLEGGGRSLQAAYFRMFSAAAAGLLILPPGIEPLGHKS
jgi:hypothetical protein